MGRRFLLAVALTFALAPALAQAGTADPAAVRPYWQVRGCDHPHREAVAAHRITKILHSPKLLTKARWRDVWHYAVCVKYRSSHLRLRGVVRAERQWRLDHRWELVAARREAMFKRLVATIPAWGQSHLASIRWCESRNNPRAIGGGGAYRGLYQFSFSTWRVVGGSGDPAAASWNEQTWRAWLLLKNYGSGHWPVCG